MDANVTLKITRTDSRSLGRCYSSTTWLIESRKPLTWDNVKSLRAAGLLGGGQEFFGHALAADGSRDTAWEAKYEYNRAVYSYVAEDRVDSSD